MTHSQENKDRQWFSCLFWGVQTSLLYFFTLPIAFILLHGKEIITFESKLNNEQKKGI